MNATREALQLLEFQIELDADLAPELRDAVYTLSAALDERDALRKACEALDAAFMSDGQSFNILAVWAARGLAREALEEAKP